MGVAKGLKNLLVGTGGFAVKRIITRFADEHGLVYFGHVDQHEDEHKLVRGVTASAKHEDSHYCVGTIDGYDIVLVQRTDVLTFPNKPTKGFSWLIMQFDLRTDKPEINHVFVNAHNHGETFYAHLFTKFNRLRKLDPSAFHGHDLTFVKSFDIYAPYDLSWTVTNLLTQEVTSMLGHHFRNLDFEITKEHVFVYASNPVVTPHLLEHMARGGLWLARYIDDGGN